MTTEQFKARTKTATRRMGWQFLKPGDLVCGVKKAMGLKKGDKLERLGVIRVVNVSREFLDEISVNDVALEGFPKWGPKEFIAMLVQHYKIKPDTMFTRIQFEYVTPTQPQQKEMKNG